MTRFTVDAGGVALSAQVDGAAGKPWLLLSNSLAADLSMWDDQIATLTVTHRVLRYDTRGHGASAAPAGPYSFDELVADMVAVLDHVGADKADVMGLSLGGMTALGLGLAEPGRVRRMVVCDARADAPPPFVQSWADRIAAIRAGGMAAVVDGTLARWFTPGVEPSVLARARAMILGTSPTGYEGCAGALKRLDYLRHLGRMAVPLRYVVGAEDLGAPPAVMRAMAEATPGASFVEIPGTAHLPNMENPAAFAAALVDFLEVA